VVVTHWKIVERGARPQSFRATPCVLGRKRYVGE
jgi:hypothetical protein